MSVQHLTKQNDTEYTCQELYMTVEQDYTGDWNVWAADNELLVTGTFEQCCKYVNTEVDKDRRANACMDNAE